MTIYVGAPGALQALPYMGRGIEASLDLGIAQQRSLTGARTADRVGDPKRTYALERKFLTAAEVSLLEQLALGVLGAEPYVLVDPWRTNVLGLNQSTSGDWRRASTGFYAIGSGTVSIVGPGTQATRGRYTVSYLSSSTGAAGTRGVAAADASTAAQVIATGVPAIPSQPYTFSLLVRSQAGTAASWRATLAFYDSSGVIIGTASNGTAATVTGSYVARTVTATSPSNAAYAVPSLTNNATLAATNTLYLGDLQLEAGSSATAWAMGTGVPKVAFTALSDSYPLPLSHDSSITLQEIG